MTDLLRVVRVPVAGRCGRAVVCACGQHVLTLPGACGYCAADILPDMVDLAAWDAARPEPAAEWAR
ncbi:MAG TPA: hypothetical protein VN697_05930 [Tepidiformaceae bacterium]|nr:hypothetical protein [Tepidiformaceae bacterium]